MNDDELSLPQFELKNTKEKKCKDTFKTGIDYKEMVHIMKRENSNHLFIACVEIWSIKICGVVRG